MKALLVNSNCERHPQPVIPVGLCAVASNLEANGFRVRVVDLCFCKDIRSTLSVYIKEFNPDVIGISIRNIDNNDYQKSIFYLEDVKKIVKICRQLSKAIIVLGGAAVNLMPVEILKFLDCHFAILGDGEFACVELLKRLARGEDFDRCPGLVYQQNGRFFANPSCQVEGFERLATNSVFKWIDVNNYARYGTGIPVQTKRGCSFDCIYCTYAKGEGKRYRLKDPRLVADEIEKLVFNVASGQRLIDFVDSVFNFPEEHALQICKEIMKRRIKACFQSLEINPGFFNEELLNLMEKIGFISMGITAESGSEKMLKNLKKGFTLKELKKTAAVVKKSKITNLWIFMFGGPGETEDTVKETFAFVNEFINYKDIVFLTTGIRMYPGTELERIAIEEGYLKKGMDLLRPYFYISRTIDQDRLFQLVTTEVNSHLNYIHISDIRISWLPLLLKITSFLRLPLPFWRYTNPINRIRRFVNPVR